MAKSYKDQLNTLSQTELVDLVLQAIDNDKSFANVVKLKIAESDPKLLEKQLKQQINGIKRGTRFLDYYASMEMGKKLYTIMTVLETKLLPLSPQHAINCCELLANICQKSLGTNVRNINIGL